MESLVRRVQETDWNQVRARWESRIGTVWAKMRQSEAAVKLREDAVAAGEELKKAAEIPQPEQSSQQKRLLEIG